MDDIQAPVDALIAAAGIDVDFHWLVRHALEQVTEVLISSGGVLREELADPEVQSELSAVKARLESFSGQYLDLYRNFLCDHFNEQELAETAAAVQSEAVRRYLRCTSDMARTLTPAFQELGRRMLQESVAAS